MSNDNTVTSHNLDTSEGARAYVAEFFASQLRRHDFRAYITTRLAADFACALAKHLAASQPAGQQPAYNAAGISLTACQLHEALLMAGDPELDVPFEDRSLVRIFSTETGHSGPGLYCECVDAEEYGCILLDGTSPVIGQTTQAVEISPEFTDTARAAIAWVLWHHQGGSSPVGQPLRFSLGMGQHDRMTDHQIAEAKRFAALSGATTKGFHHHKRAQGVDLGTGVQAIAGERERQLCVEGFSPACDEQYLEGELARAATAYAQLAAMDLQAGTRSHIASSEPPFFWPWAPEWWKPVDARRDLVRAGALIAAQIDLLDSQAMRNG